VRKLNPTLRLKGLTFGRWRLRGELVELWGLEDPAVEDPKYSFRIQCKLKSTARGRMCVPLPLAPPRTRASRRLTRGPCAHARRNKLEMLSMATEHRQTLELEDLPIRPTKPFFFSKVQAYANEDRVQGES